MNVRGGRGMFRKLCLIFALTTNFAIPGRAVAFDYIQGDPSVTWGGDWAYDGKSWHPHSFGEPSITRGGNWVYNGKNWHYQGWRHSHDVSPCWAWDPFGGGWVWVCVGPGS
jgi:hypothetical protein